MSGLAGRIATLSVVAALIYGIGWLGGKASVADSYRTLAGLVEAQNNEAARQLAELTRERDDKQAMLDKQAEEQEKQDAERLAEIDRLAGELRDRPVRVRVVNQPGACGSSSASERAATTGPGTGGGAETYGLLPESNSRRLAGALNEVERLSAAYNSCRARLLRDHKEADASGGT